MNTLESIGFKITIDNDPRGFTWLAQDFDGYWYLYCEKPFFNPTHKRWVCKSRKSAMYVGVAFSKVLPNQETFVAYLGD